MATRPYGFATFGRPGLVFFRNRNIVRQHPEELFVCSLAPPLHKELRNSAMKNYEQMARGPPKGDLAFFVGEKIFLYSY
jgi:hypothetical protein